MKKLLILLLLLSSCGSNKNDNMNTLQDKWAKFLIGDTTKIQKDDPYVQNLSKKATKLLETALTNTNRTTIWQEYNQWNTNPAHITKLYRNITPIVMAYKTPGTAQYQDPKIYTFITNSLDWLAQNVYLPTGESYGNWWDWQIGIPGDLVKIVIILHDELSIEQKNRYMASLQHHLPTIGLDNPRHTGANLADVALIKILEALITDNKVLLDDTIIKVKTLYKYVDKGDGFYQDGSFIQHSNIAYTGSYGNVLLGRLSNILYLLSHTQWDILNPMLYEWVYNSIEPIIYHGSVIDNVRGRSVARFYDDAAKLGIGFTESLLKITLVADKTNQTKLEHILKSWLKVNKDMFFKGNPASIINIEAKRILNDTNIKTEAIQNAHFAFNYMERNVHRRSNYTLSIARSSVRIAKDESINNENITPWYQGDGTVSLYNDVLQYADSYWPTLDPYHMPGVTRVVRPRIPTTGKIVMINGKSVYVNDFPREDIAYNIYSGSVALGSYGSAAMTISNKNETLYGQKSWFMFDDEIVFINSKISDTSQYKVETTLENRRLLKNNQLLVNNKATSQYMGLAKTIYIQDNEQNKSLGYFFPEETTIMFSLITNIGAWTNINISVNGGPITSTSLTSRPLTNRYALLTYDHGINPKNDTLIYYLLPNISPQQLQKYQNPIEILALSNNIHGVFHNQLNILALHFFKAGQYNHISANRELLFMEQLTNNSHYAAISDPIFSDTPLTISISGVKTFSLSKGLTGKLINNVLTISVDTAQKKIYYFHYN